MLFSTVSVPPRPWTPKFRLFEKTERLTVVLPSKRLDAGLKPIDHHIFHDERRASQEFDTDEAVARAVDLEVAQRDDVARRPR